ncbi:Glycerophosphoryl diester phosphodiesterase [hydrothermal vent metagenome]|uniref:Glycerophosphoryl diester phosphodiesterase n=1 Tax=hydrothermal vent metagenome TaxID=652676 RepID=A0A3B0ZXR9_9ZZZZ
MFIDKSKKPQDYLVAHRGYSQSFPENTLLAIQAALDEGAKYIEIDIQLSADKQAVVFHDRDLQRLCHQPDSIHDYSLQTLRSFSSYSPDRFKDKYFGEKIATLDEVVALFSAYPEVTLFVELKRISIDEFGDDVVLGVIENCLRPIISQCVIISFSFDILELIREKKSLPFGAVPVGAIPVGAILDEWNAAITTEYTRLERLNPEYFFCDIASLPDKGQLNLLNSKIITYECIEPEKAIAVLQQGVSFVETFNIKGMLQGIKNEWSRM